MAVPKSEMDVEKTGESGLGTSSTPEWDVGTNHNGPKDPWATRFVDSFRRDPNARVTKKADMGDEALVVGSREYDHRAAAERTANSGLAHKLKGRHMQMIAIGGSIGKFECAPTFSRTGRNSS